MGLIAAQGQPTISFQRISPAQCSRHVGRWQFPQPVQSTLKIEPNRTKTLSPRKRNGASQRFTIGFSFQTLRNSSSIQRVALFPFPFLLGVFGQLWFAFRHFPHCFWFDSLAFIVRFDFNSSVFWLLFLVVKKMAYRAPLPKVRALVLSSNSSTYGFACRQISQLGKSTNGNRAFLVDTLALVKFFYLFFVYYLFGRYFICHSVLFL